MRQKIAILLFALCATATVNAQVTVGELVYRINSGSAYVSAVVDGTQTDITIPASITYDNGGTETTAPVRGIWPSAFKNNAVLKNVHVLTNTNYFTFQANCFEGCTTLEKVTFEAASGNQNRYYYNYAFKDCTSLTQVGPTANRVQLANNLTNNSEGVFMGCTSVQGVVYRYSSTKIGKDWFKGCTSLTVANLVNASEVGESAFEGCTALTAVNVTSTSSTVVNMSYGANCFKGCTAMTYAQFDQVKRPITAIPDGMFEGCTSLASVYSASSGESGVAVGDFNGIVSIGANAFKDCTSLTRYGRTSNVAIFPDDLTEIGASAFEGCTALGTFRLFKMDAAPTVGTDAFTGIKANSYFYLYPSNSYKSAGKYALSDDWKVYFDGTKGSNFLIAYVNKSKQYGTVSCDVPLYFYSATYAANLYKVKATSQSLAALKEVSSRKLPANTGAVLDVMVDGAIKPSTPVQVLFNNSASAADFAGNLLVANVSDNTEFKGQENGKYNLILVDGEFVKANDGTLAGGLAYLPVALNSADAKLSLTFDDEVTGIENVENEALNAADDAWYTPQGVRVAQPTKGVYIHNGKKVMVK